MGFVVYHPGGNTNAEFEAYVRLLRQRGVDIGKLPRVPDPETGQRWLYVWDTQEKADAFAAELKKRTASKNWVVRSSQARPTQGPVGPILIQLARRADGLSFELHPLSQAMIGSIFPHAIGATNTIFVDARKWSEFLKVHDFARLVRDVIPTLTGLPLGQIDELGYWVVDSDSDETVLKFDPVRGQAG